MSYITNTTDEDLEVPSLGLVIPAGQAVQVGLDVSWVNSDALKVTKTAPKSAPVVDPVAPLDTPNEEN